ncbi:MAG: hypothetical protein HFI09_01015, partial [Bacilli bacterium]|nr:hypothetical protein [Bacilli bacterium]
MIPWYQLGIHFKTLIAGGKIMIDTKYVITGFFFILSYLLKLIEFRIQHHKKLEKDLIINIEKAFEEIFIEGLLIILAFNGFISVIIPVIFLSKNILVSTMKKLSADNGKMNEKSKLGLTEYITLRLGILSLLFYNLPFELWDFYFADALIMIATVLSALNGCIYYFNAKNMLMNQA